MSEAEPTKFSYVFDRAQSMASARFAAARLTPRVYGVWIGLLALIFVATLLQNLLPTSSFFGEYGALGDGAWLVIVVIAAALFVPRLARRIALSDLRRREPDGFDVSVLQNENGIEVSWKNTSLRFGWADVTQVMIGAKHLIIIHGANLSVPIPISSFGAGDGLRAFIRTSASKLTPAAIERSRAFIGPYLV